MQTKECDQPTCKRHHDHRDFTLGYISFCSDKCKQDYTEQALRFVRASNPFERRLNDRIFNRKWYE